MIQVKHLVREFDSVQGFIKHKKIKKKAVDDISFEIHKGEIFSLLGPNGAGKTTTIKILTTLLAPTSGTCLVNGYDTFKDAKKIRKHINFIFGGELGVYRRISGRENMEYFASLYGVDKKIRKQRIDQLLNQVGLSDAQNAKVETYSKGMIQRLQIARGLINNPDILFLDEPTIGLDPIGAKDLRNIILSLKAQNRTILLTTHDMHEADILSDRIAIINHGKIIALDTPEKLKLKYQENNVLEMDVDCISDIQYEKLKRLAQTQFIERTKKDYYEHVYIQYQGDKGLIRYILEILETSKILRISERGTHLEDVYIRLVEKTYE